ncbi:MAG: pilus assembly protein PilP [Thermodesulfobacteriota bacterium]
MTKRLAGFILIALSASVLFLGCGREEPDMGPIKRAPRPAQKPAAGPEAARQIVGQVAPLGAKQRNPFQNYILLTRGDEKAGKIRGPLECCELELFKINGVVLAQDDSYALVQAPDGKRYIVRPGFVMGLREGKVIGIDTGGLTVREYVRDSRGKVISKNDVELKLLSKRPAKR